MCKNAELRVKRGIVGLSGAATAGQLDTSGNDIKETIDGSFVTDGFGGNKAEANVHSDNGWSNGYDMGDTVTFPSLSDMYEGKTFQQALQSAVSLLEGRYAIVALDNHTSTIGFAKNGSPLVIGKSDTGYVLASDASAFTSSVTTIAYISDTDYGILDGSPSGGLSLFRKKHGAQQHHKCFYT